MKTYIALDSDNNIVAMSSTKITVANCTTQIVEEELQHDKFDGYSINNNKVFFDTEKFNNRLLERKKNTLRDKREIECFDIVNRGDMWYKTYINTPERETEFKNWYQAWLNVTETMVEPKTPEWIK